MPFLCSAREQPYSWLNCVVVDYFLQLCQWTAFVYDCIMYPEALNLMNYQYQAQTKPVYQK